MENKKYNQFPTWSLIILIVAITTILNVVPALAEEEAETYIVQLSSPPGQTLGLSVDLESWYTTFLPTITTKSNIKKPSLVYAYRNILAGFAAKMTVEQAREMEERNEIMSVRPQTVFSLLTTHTPSFLGLHQNLGFWSSSNYGKGIIIGLLDTGITPGHPSYNDTGMPPPPVKWKGKCEVSGCNNKLIGVRNFVSGGSSSPLDEGGHGTHTSSTAAGNFVHGANVFGNDNGTAVGMAPLAHLAMYKVCNETNCSESDILAAMDAAVEEGVDVISISIGGPSRPFYDDAIATGAFTAIQKGIFVSCGAGNSGPSKSTLSNEAPWILTVGASTVDRKLRATVKLGNNDLLDGESVFQPKDFQPTLLPLVYPGTNNENASWCAPGSLNNFDVKGKVVVCLRGGGVARIDKGQTVKDAGGGAMILINQDADGDSTSADTHVLPASYVGYKEGLTILQYLNSTTLPVATIIFHGTVIGVKTAPQVTSFSSRGPSLSSPGILKPDIIGPGVSILAAWPVSVDNRTTKSTFNVVSGTSMSCPHLSGIVALMKSAHPDWSPAAIKSAIMTTADLVNLNNKPIEDERELQADLFAIGAGHVNPSKASDPGLVYDIQPDDYIPYLCGLGYSNTQIVSIVQKQVSCANTSSIPEAQLNYPSFAITLVANTSKTYMRVVTNVGYANSSYDVIISPAPGVKIVVSPSTLTFSAVNQKLSYQVSFIPSGFDPKIKYGEGALIWISMKNSVRSPISIRYV